jgi:hypothetical protein
MGYKIKSEINDHRAKLEAPNTKKVMMFWFLTLIKYATIHYTQLYIKREKSLYKCLIGPCFAKSLVCKLGNLVRQQKWRATSSSNKLGGEYHYYHSVSSILLDNINLLLRTTYNHSMNNTKIPMLFQNKLFIL